MKATIILVSHDRYFISKAANKIWEIADGEIKEFKGTYAEYVEWKERMAAKNETQKKVEKQKPAPAPVEIKQAPAEPKGQPINKELKKELQKQQKLYQQCEDRIAVLTDEKKKLEASLASPDIYSDKHKYTQTEAAYKKAETELAKLNREYELVFEKIVELESNGAQKA